MLGGRTFDERCDDLEGALGRRGSAAAARLRRSRLFGAASSPARLLLRAAACAVAAANIIRGLPDGGGVLRMAYEFAEGALCSYCFWRGYRLGIDVLGYFGGEGQSWRGWATDFLLVWEEVGKMLETSEGSQWSANVQMIGVLVLIFKALSWFWFVGPTRPSKSSRRRWPPRPCGRRRRSSTSPPPWSATANGRPREPSAPGRGGDAGS